MQFLRLCLVLCLLATLPADAAELDFGDDSGPRTDAGAGGARAGGLPIRFIRVEGTIDRPVVEEIPAGDPLLGHFAKLDYGAGIARQMSHFQRVSKGRPLLVCITNRPDENTPRHTTSVPLDHSMYIKWEIPLADGTKLAVQEPHPILVFPRHVLQRFSQRDVTRAFKHELGHSLHELNAPIHDGGMEETFGAHNLPLRTNGRQAFSEGFAEFTAFRFRDSDDENDPRVLDDVVTKRNPRAHWILLGYHFVSFRARPLLTKRVPAAELFAAQKRLVDELKRRSAADQPMPLAEFRAAVVKELTGKGRPTLQARELQAELATHEQENGPAMANLNLEEERLNGDPREPRSPVELFRTEGVAVKVLLELDKELSGRGIDFYGKLLETMPKDPYGGRSDPKESINLKELLAMLDRDPELTGKIFPAVSRATRGALRAEDFRLAPSREDEPVDAPTPGTVEEQLRQYRSKAAKATPPADAETKPGFDGLRQTE
ncbi:MAG: hypothetical protein HY816_21500 [Candidatus Wallbacteria bacterium]|nr:hypothetical protein [Candidatus Wallbacteria bacterium]